MRQFRLAGVMLIAALASLSTVACGDDEDPTGPGSVQGTYTLRTIGGESVPLVYEDNEFFKGEILSGSITLSANGVCSATIAFRDTDKETGEVDEGSEGGACTYTVNGSTLTLVFEDEEPATATLSGDTITVTEDGEAWVFRK